MMPKFRLFDKVDRQMRAVHVINMYLNEITCYEPNNHDYTHEDTYHYEEESLKHVILMQSTGLHDKNGKEIYINDILQDKFGDYHIVKQGEYFYSDDDYHISEAIGFYLEDRRNNCTHLNTMVKQDYLCAVVKGNIHENSDLLINSLN